MTATLIVLAAFVLMEPTAAFLHRRVMHRPPGWAWHVSHHRADRRPDRPQETRATGPEDNDRFPVVFAVLTVAMFAAGAASPELRPLTWIATGVTAYGVAYLVVHDGYVHGRVGTLPGSESRYIRWVRTEHVRHHRTGAAPYGFLLPLTRGPLVPSPRPARFLPSKAEQQL